MTATFIISPILVLLVVLVLVFLFTRLTGPGRGLRTLAVDRARLRHPVIRIVCGLLALVLAGAVSIASWQATSPRSADSEPQLLLTDIPALIDTPLIPDEDAERPEAPPKPRQLVYTVIAAAVEGDALIPVDGASVLIDLSQPSQTHSIRGSLPGGTFEASIDVHDLQPDHRDHWYAQGNRRTEYRRGSSSGSSSGGLYHLDQVEIERVFSSRGAVERSALSILPERSGGRMVLLTRLSSVHDEAPRQVPASEWLRRHATEIRRHDERSLHDIDWSPTVPNGVAMLQYTGPGSALLLLAAILAAQVFRQRGFAFVAATALAVLLAISMDRIMVERHAKALADPELPAERQSLVKMRLNGSFFHAGRVEDILGAKQP